MAHGEIKQVYQMPGKEATAYDGMITCPSFFGKIICESVWDMDKANKVCLFTECRRRISSYDSGAYLFW